MIFALRSTSQGCLVLVMESVLINNNKKTSGQVHQRQLSQHGGNRRNSQHRGCCRGRTQAFEYVSLVTLPLRLVLKALSFLPKSLRQHPKYTFHQAVGTLLFKMLWNLPVRSKGRHRNPSSQGKTIFSSPLIQRRGSYIEMTKMTR